jgi:hypothetical protein
MGFQKGSTKSGILVKIRFFPNWELTSSPREKSLEFSGIRSAFFPAQNPGFCPVLLGFLAFPNRSCQLIFTLQLAQHTRNSKEHYFATNTHQNSLLQPRFALLFMELNGELDAVFEKEVRTSDVEDKFICELGLENDCLCSRPPNDDEDYAVELIYGRFPPTSTRRINGMKPTQTLYLVK